MWKEITCDMQYDLIFTEVAQNKKLMELLCCEIKPLTFKGNSHSIYIAIFDLQQLSHMQQEKTDNTVFICRMM
jgi:hypothetical protein